MIKAKSVFDRICIKLIATEEFADSKLLISWHIIFLVMISDNNTNNVIGYSLLDFLAFPRSQDTTNNIF